MNADKSTHLTCPVLSAVFLLTLLIFSLHIPVKYAFSFELLVGTGDTSSFSYFAGKSICRLIKNSDKNIGCKPVPSEGYSDTLTNLQNGSFDLALVNSKMIYDATHKAGFFEYVDIDFNDLRLLTPLYKSPICLITQKRSNINNLDELEGKRVNGGPPLSLESLIFQKLMEVQGWQVADFKLFQNISAQQSQDYIALRNGSVEAMLHMGMHPDRAINQLLNSNDINLASVSNNEIKEMIQAKIGFSQSLISANTYPGLPENLHTLGMETLLITSADTDEETISIVLEALISDKDRLQQIHPLFLHDPVSVETLNNSYLHPHPAAVLYFQMNINKL